MHKYLGKFIIVLVLMIVLLPFISSVSDSNAVRLRTNADCTEDIYNCTDWSACMPNGTQTRVCTLVSMCPNADNTKPLETGFCVYTTSLSSKLKCSDIEIMTQRIDCRLQLTKTDLSEGLNIAYMPEDCRAIYDSVQKDRCIQSYSDSQRCYALEGDNKNICLKKLLNISDINTRKNSCQDDSCLNSLRNDVYTMVKFRISDLEQNAILMANKGLISRSQAVQIIVQLEQEKLAFDNAASTQARVDSLSSAKQKWKDFINGLKEAAK